MVPTIEGLEVQWLIALAVAALAILAPELLVPHAVSDTLDELQPLVVGLLTGAAGFKLFGWLSNRPRK